jgi:MFS family permease
VLLAVGLLTSVGGPVPAAYLADVAPQGRIGAATGVYRTCGDLATVLGPVILGWVLDHGGPAPAVAVLALVSIGAGLIFAALARPPGRRVTVFRLTTDDRNVAPAQNGTP